MNCLQKSKTTWPKVKLEDIFDEVCEKNHPDADVLTIIQGVGTVLRAESGRDIVYDKNSLSSYKFVQKGDFIIHLRSFEGGVEMANQDGIVSPAYIILHPKSPVSSVYLYALFHSKRFINQTMAPAVEGARDGRSVKYDVLKKQSILFPPIGEQKKIAEILATQDKVIELKGKLIAEKRKQKCFIMSSLFPKGMLNKRLSDVCENLTKRVTSGRSCYVSTENMVSYYGGVIFGENKQCVDGIAFKKDDILVANIRPYLKKVWRATLDGTCSADVLVFRGKNVDSFFLYYLIANDNYVDYVMSGVKGTKMPRGDKKYIMQMPICVPSLPKQQSIVKILSSADEEISLLQKELELEKLKKKSLMQLLLTGLVRVGA